MTDGLKFLGIDIAAIIRSLTAEVTFSFAMAAWIILLVHTQGWFLFPSIVTTTALIIGIICSCFVITNSWAATKRLRDYLFHQFHLWQDKKRIEKEIPFLTPHEKNILGYLLTYNQKMIEVLPDGEDAATLMAKGFLVLPNRCPLEIHRDIQVVVPDHIWKILVNHKENFSYRPVMNHGVETDPWRTHWMAR